MPIWIGLRGGPNSGRWLALLEWEVSSLRDEDRGRGCGETGSSSLMSEGLTDFERGLSIKGECLGELPAGSNPRGAGFRFVLKNAGATDLEWECDGPTLEIGELIGCEILGGNIIVLRASRLSKVPFNAFFPSRFFSKGEFLPLQTVGLTAKSCLIVGAIDGDGVGFWSSLFSASSLSRASYSSSIARYSFSVQQPCQQFFQSQTKNQKQKASIFMQGWKQIHKFL